MTDERGIFQRILKKLKVLLFFAQYSSLKMFTIYQRECNLQALMRAIVYLRSNGFVLNVFVFFRNYSTA